MKLINSVLLVALCTAIAFGQETGQCSKRTVSANGRAEIGLAPDYAELHIGVDTMNADVRKAMTANSEAVRNVIQVAKKFGIAENDITLDYVNLQAHRNWDEGKPPIYEATQKIQIKLRDLKRYDEAMALLVEAGANRIDSVDFRIAQATRRLDEARAAAFDAARAKAEILSKRAGLRLGKACTIQETAFSGFFSTNGAGIVANGAGRVNVSTVPGQVAASTDVSVTFELLD